MSYIRCASNPEGLYVFGGPNCVEFHFIDSEGEMRSVNCPYEAFDNFFRELRRHEKYRYYVDTGYPFSYGGVRLEVHDSKIGFTVGNETVWMYETTWNTIRDAVYLDQDIHGPVRRWFSCLWIGVCRWWYLRNL